VTQLEQLGWCLNTTSEPGRPSSMVGATSKNGLLNVCLQLRLLLLWQGSRP
jgi:hypothetical protein